MGPPDSRRVTRAPRYSGWRLTGLCLRVRGSHPLRLRFPARFRSTEQRPSWRPCNPHRPASKPTGLGSAPFARRYWGYHCCFLFLRVLRCFSSPRSPPCIHGWRRSTPPGCPIRTSADHRLHAPTRGFSQLAASFIAFRSQGIRRAPFSSFSPRHRPTGQRRACLLAFVSSGRQQGRPTLVISFFRCCVPTCQRTDGKRATTRPLGAGRHSRIVENIGFEPMASCVRCKRSSQAELIPRSAIRLPNWEPPPYGNEDRSTGPLSRQEVRTI